MLLPASRAADLDPYVPPDSEWVVQFNVKQLAAAPAVKKHAEERLGAAVRGGLAGLKLLTDLGVSGHHARIYRGPDGYAIEDLKSRNGVWVNGTRVFHSQLAHGDQLRLGATELRFELLFEGEPVSARA